MGVYNDGIEHYVVHPVHLLEKERFIKVKTLGPSYICKIIKLFIFLLHMYLII